MLSTLSNNVELLKYLSATENSTVSVLSVWFMFPSEYIYVNSGFIKSVNIVPSVFLSMSSSLYITFTHEPVSSVADILWFP